VGFDVALPRRANTPLKVFQDEDAHHAEPRFHKGDIQLSYKVLTAKEKMNLEVGLEQ
jgi:hypothetical protein